MPLNSRFICYSFDTTRLKVFYILKFALFIGSHFHQTTELTQLTTTLNAYRFRSNYMRRPVSISKRRLIFSLLFITALSNPSNYVSRTSSHLSDCFLPSYFLNRISISLKFFMQYIYRFINFDLIFCKYLSLHSIYFPLKVLLKNQVENHAVC